MSSFLFCLGGHDLEMLTIKQLLEDNAQFVVDKQLRWGAVASAYREEIEQALVQNRVPVLIELENDLAFEPVILIDHHGDQAGETAPTALHQVFDLLQLPAWSRWFELVAANDRGYIPALEALNASHAEICQIRLADRRAQGVSEHDDLVAHEAIQSMVVYGALSVVYLGHNRTAAVTDALFLEGIAYRNLLIISPEEVNFFGEGEWVAFLVQRFPDGWYGGALPTRGFWGCQGVGGSQVLESLLGVRSPNFSLR